MDSFKGGRGVNGKVNSEDMGIIHVGNEGGLNQTVNSRGDINVIC